MSPFGQRCNCSAPWELDHVEPVSETEFHVWWKCTRCGVVSVEVRSFEPVPGAQPLWRMPR
jgi:hypothetical protein